MPSVPDYMLRGLEPKADKHLRLASQANVAKPQACHACQQRKRKCDRKRPSCSMCEKRSIECVFDVKITDRSHPNFLTNLLKSLEDKDLRIKALEALVNARVPMVSGAEKLSTEEIAALSETVSPLQASITAASPTTARAGIAAVHPLGAGYGSEPMSPALVASVEERLSKIDLRSSTRTQPSVVTYMHSQLGGITDNHQPDETTQTTSQVASWPPYELAVQVVKVFVECNAMYPILRLDDLLSNLDEIYQPNSPNPGNPDTRATPLQTYTLFLVFALGFVWLARRMNGEKIDTSLLCNRALSCLSTVLHTEPAVTCLSSVFLLSFWSVFDSGGPDLVPLVPIISDLVLEVGLNHEPPSHLPDEEKDRRRILFWAIFCQERAMSGVLSTTILLDEEDITVRLPARLDPIGTLAEGIDPVAFYSHNVAMRRLFWAVNQYVHGAAPTVEDRDTLQERLDEWYAATPRPAAGPTQDGFFDLYFHTIRANLFRPHGLTNLPIEHLTILKDSASNAMSIAMNLYEQRKYVDNYFHLYNAMSMGLTLLYTLLLTSRSTPEVLLDEKWRTGATSVVARCQMVVGAFCRGWPFSRGLTRAFDALSARIVAGLTGGEQLVPPLTDVAASAVATLSLDSTIPSTLDFLPRHSDREWDAWLNGSIGHLTFDYDAGLQPQQYVPHPDMELDADEFDNLMATVGWIPEWPADMDLSLDVPAASSL